jgi:AraC-like DNA-binding protein/uncharacterized cupin superfamily protein
MQMERYFQYGDGEFSCSYTYTQTSDLQNFSMHTHENHELYYFLSGRGVYRIESSEYPMRPGDILIMRRAESHYFDIDKTVPYKRFTLNFSESLFDGIDPNGMLMRPFYERELGKGNLYRKGDFPDDTAARLISRMLAPETDIRTEVLACLPALLGEISRVWRERRQSEPEEAPLSYRIVSFVNDHLTDELSLDAIAARFYISKPQLCRVFKAATGSTVWEYVTIKRLIRAREIIGAGTSPTEAAGACGFNDYSAFYRAYRRQFGHSPREK